MSSPVALQVLRGQPISADQVRELLTGGDDAGLVIPQIRALRERESRRAMALQWRRSVIKNDTDLICGAWALVSELQNLIQAGEHHLPPASLGAGAWLAALSEGWMISDKEWALGWAMGTFEQDVPSHRPLGERLTRLCSVFFQAGEGAEQQLDEVRVLPESGHALGVHHLLRLRAGARGRPDLPLLTRPAHHLMLDWHLQQWAERVLPLCGEHGWSDRPSFKLSRDQHTSGARIISLLETMNPTPSLSDDLMAATDALQTPNLRRWSRAGLPVSLWVLSRVPGCWEGLLKEKGRYDATFEAELRLLRALLGRPDESPLPEGVTPQWRTHLLALQTWLDAQEG